VDVIPVIDLKDGVVVHARMGRRDAYRPIATPLSPTSAPVDVVRGLLSVYPFTTLYVADLDAIERRGNNGETLRRLRAAFPSLVVWVDSGIADRRAAENWLRDGLGHLVLGSEALPDDALVHRFSAHPRVVLSLDFRGDRFLGPLTLLDAPQAWPVKVIVMTLARVGSGAGPDLDRLCAIRAAAPDKQIYAAGGIRNGADLAALQEAGIAGALVASSLHDGRLSGRDLERIFNRTAARSDQTAGMPIR